MEYIYFFVHPTHECVNAVRDCLSQIGHFGVCVVHCDARRTTHPGRSNEPISRSCSSPTRKAYSPRRAFAIGCHTGLAVLRNTLIIEQARVALEHVNAPTLGPIIDHSF